MDKGQKVPHHQPRCPTGWLSLAACPVSRVCPIGRSAKMCQRITWVWPFSSLYHWWRRASAPAQMPALGCNSCREYRTTHESISPSRTNALLYHAPVSTRQAREYNKLGVNSKPPKFGRLGAYQPYFRTYLSYLDSLSCSRYGLLLIAAPSVPSEAKLFYSLPPSLSPAPSPLLPSIHFFDQLSLMCCPP